MPNTRTVMGQSEQSGFKTMEYTAYSPDLTSCDFLLFGYINKQLKGRSFAGGEERLSVLSELMGEISPGMIVRVFADWNQKLRFCCLMEGENGE
jgi:hypothetical protein